LGEGFLCLTTLVQRVNNKFYFLAMNNFMDEASGWQADTHDVLIINLFNVLLAKNAQQNHCITLFMIQYSSRAGT
jgi:hypothetical protein